MAVSGPVPILLFVLQGVKMPEQRCPLCGHDHEPHPWQVSTFRDYHAAAFGEAAPPREFKEWRRSTPLRAPAISSDVLVPLLTAGISGVIAGACTIPFVFAWSLPWWSPLIVGLAILAIVWALRAGLGWRLLFASERIIGHDINQDGTVGKPMVRLAVTKDDGHGHQSMYFPELPTSEEKLAILAKGAVGGRPLSQGVWTGSQGIFSRSEFEGVMEQLTRLGFVRWCGDDHRQGRELTPAGQHAFKDLLIRSGK